VVRNDPNLTWAYLHEVIPDPATHQAIEHAGGHRVIADGVSDERIIKRFRHAYEQIVAITQHEHEGDPQP
jgi:hypothetical protein